MSGPENNAPPKRSQRGPGMFVAFKPGQPVLVQAMGDSQRYWGRVIGVDPYDYFILKLPLVPGILRLATQGASLTLRMENEGELYGFSCDVIAVTHKPHPLAILSYPATAERLQLRQHKRVKCLIPAMVQNDFFNSSGFVVDLSRGGCRLVLDLFQKQRIVNLMTGDAVSLSISLDSMTSCKCAAKVVALQDVGTGRALGLSFDQDCAAGKSDIQEFVDRLETLSNLLQDRE
ncbi:Cyclic di-GMP binding protein [Fundidesulfovibrio magnetotacticus]|uniref:Cyclic di-GMP binding protein n=1 Tax=Fundidesulfovibrio magnetotacticus TaxID=2730080 RepID=A0A6V8LUZ6_9BACT|nr:flagellar brake protein [Fundidesulfovibrio magnetotacticus]GFK93487.1 Cyclic di-GMP binding protein [Fundidesulfovibrio magnetotacticus]